MAYKDLQQFVERLENEGELKTVDKELDPSLEIAEVTDRVSKLHGPALLFTRPTGGRFPVLAAWPTALRMDPKVRKRADAGWSEPGLGKGA